MRPKWRATLVAVIIIVMIAASSYRRFVESRLYGPAMTVAVFFCILLMTLSALVWFRSLMSRGQQGSIAKRALFTKLIVFAVAAVILGGAFEIADDAVARRMAIEDMAVGQLRSFPFAEKCLGTPIRVGWPISANIDKTLSVERAELDIPVHGTRMHGWLHVRGTEQDRVWTIQAIYLTLAGSATRIAVPH